MAEGLIKFTYREGTKTPPVISEWLRAKPDGMSYPEYLNVVLLECLSDEDSREQVAEEVAAGAAQAPVAASAGAGVTADEIRGIVSGDGDLTREAIREIAGGARVRGEHEGGDALSTAGAEELAQSLIEAVERDGAATREAMESLSQMLSESRGADEDAADGAGESGGSLAPSDADLERIVTRLKDSIITDGQKTREMLSNLLESLPASDGDITPVAAAGTAGAFVGEGSELREMLRSDMLDMVTAIREDGRVLREDIGNVVAEATGGQSLSFDDDTAQFFGNLHRGIANILSRVDAMQVQMEQVQQAVTENRTAIWEDGLKQEKAIRQSYDEVIEALDRIGDGAVREREEDALPEGLDFSVPDMGDEADSADEGIPAAAPEASTADTGDEGVTGEDVPVSAFLGDLGEGHTDAMGQDDLRRAVDMLLGDDTPGDESAAEEANLSAGNEADEAEPAGDAVEVTPEVGSGALPETADGEGADETAAGMAADAPEAGGEPVAADPIAALGRMFGMGGTDAAGAGEPVEHPEKVEEPAAPEEAPEVPDAVDDIPAVPMTDPREAFLNEPVTHAPTTSWSADSSAPYGGLVAPTPEPEDDGGEDEGNEGQGRLGDMLRSLLG